MQGEAKSDFYFREITLEFAWRRDFKRGKRGGKTLARNLADKPS